MNLKMIFALVLAGCLLIASAPSPGFAKEGKEYHRVVSLGPLVTDMIYLLEADDRLEGVTTYCIIPEGKPDKEIIGTVIQMNVEKIVSLEPDAVFAGTLTRLKQIEAFEKQGLNVIRFDNPANFEEICSMFLAIGTYLGKTQTALEIIKETTAAVDAIREKAQTLPSKTVFIQIGVKPLKTSERGTFISSYIELAGGINIAEAGAAGVYSRENVLKVDPDVILVATMGSSGKLAETEKERWMGFETLKAARNRQIYALDSDLVCSPTPVSFVHALNVFFECIHPEYSKETE